MLEKLITAICEMKEKEAVVIAENLLTSGAEPLDLIDACQKAMKEIGNRFSKGQCFIPELILSGEIMKQISEKSEPYFKQGAVKIKKARSLWPQSKEIFMI
jgi:methanogenic corrinoid protein MtbC1